ncbi:MAG: Hsp20/alpha crystallin family protein [Candidatus Hydrogenedentes bacterium]|nr:Hsp20/alpha crystallin family protein [Candidatus Hydrogenedentota bacterium]
MTFGYLSPLTLRVQPRGNGGCATRIQSQSQPVQNLAGWPPVNLYEEAEKYALELSVPGFQAEDFRITLEQDVLRVHGMPKKDASQPEQKWQRREWQNAEFTYRKRVPRPVLEDGIQARYENGILTVTLPKAPEAQPRTIPITTGKE